ncbi:MAG: Crp/Fnr family transcriptional regulator [Hellea sp.]|nr:Crp/Fnr family transcriptional regulator [Hellea sp.]
MSTPRTAAPILPQPVRALGITKNYNKDAVLHHQEDVNHHICFILSGRAFATSIDVDGDETWVAEYVVGQFMGCESLFDQTPTRFQIVAKTPLTGVLFPRDSFLALMNKYPELNNMVAADLTRQIQDFTLQTLETNSLSVHGRIAAELRRQARPIGNNPGNFIIRPTPVFSELAQRLGSSRETVSRAVSKMIKADVLERRTGALVVTNMARLDGEVD